ncbi:type II CRISPR RNA-guided endonuclease Cas9 [Lederbergia ruris]|uniref:type II CRISPR RNA-guided endonuclease Cas9 n=1 Tax=Lederbergia ruris TaxID=217495 RepID=UPI0039A296B9
MSKVLGLDIGISSVGWGIIDAKTGEIIDAGVRLFEEATRNANEERRSFRGARRLKRRRTHRLERFKNLMEEAEISLAGVGKINPYEARKKAIYEKVSEEELGAALYHLVKRRGVVLDAPDEDSASGNELSTKDQLSKNKKLLDSKYICEVQLERLANPGEKLRNHENRFRTADYVIEAKAILSNQKKFHKKVTNEFKDNIIKLIETRREYFEGPGSKKSPTPYGPYFIDDQGNLVETTMINKMRGKCTYFPDEYRIPKMSYTADLFNLLNGDLNKLQIEGEYLTPEDKRYLVEHFIHKGRNITLSQILKYKGVPADAVVTGYRMDMKTDKPTFTEFKGYKKILKIVREHELPKDMLQDVDLLDELVNILTAEKSYTRREEQLMDLLIMYDENTKMKIINAFRESTDFVGYHALSKKAMNLIMDDLWETNLNQMELFSELKLEEKRLATLTKSKNIQFDDEAILSTVAKRAHREAIKIVNAARKKYGEFATIVVETAREKNSEEKRKQYADFQRKQGKFEKRMAGLLNVKNLADLKLSSKQHLALKLWDSQDGKCLYSGKSISVHDIVGNPSLFEIDHILPISLSFDDSQANKVLCYHRENQEKGQRTPFQYFSSGKSIRSFEEFKVDALNLYKARKITNKKKDYLLEQRDLQNNEELQKQFINRNLVDTQYAMRSFSMSLRTYFKANNIDTTVLSIRGSFTAALRRRARLNKDRDESYAHHAIDALIVAAIGKMPVFEFFREFDMNDQGVVFNKATGEILEEQDFFKHSFIVFLRRLMNYESKIRYSHKVDRKGNRTMSNQTIYGTREKDGEKFYLGKSGNIYQLDKSEINSLLKKLKTKPDSFLIAEHNPELFKLILKIVDEHASSDNPFKAYYEEHGYILKDGKVPVKTLRYRDRKLGVHMNITDKYPDANNDVVLLSIKGVRVDLYRNDEGKYKYIGVPYHWFRQVGNRLEIDLEKYENEKRQSYKQIDDSYEFQLSLYQNDLFSFKKNDQFMERVFRGDNNPRQNKIEVDYVNKRKEQQKEGFLAPSTISDVIKYNVDVLGNRHKILKEKFNSYLQM